MGFSSPEQQQALLSLSFEPHPDGFIYYRNAWSRGIPVTADERAAYLAIPIAGSRSAWKRSISNRSTVPPRPYWPTLHKILAAMPFYMAVIAILFGAAWIASGLSSPTFLWAAIYIVAGSAFTVFGVGLIVSRLVPVRT